MSHGPLEGVRVLDLSRFIAGPHCSMILGDLGADVVKVERPGTGDESRLFHPQVDGESLYFFALNRNKRSISLDLKVSRDRETFLSLAEHADVVIENFRPETMERLDLGWDVLEERNPRLVMARIVGYAAEGPWSRLPCFDHVAQASSGLAHLTGHPDSPPTPAGVYVVDYSASLYATIAILAALEARRRTGRGQLVRTSLYDTAISLLTTAIPEASLGQEAERLGARDRYSAPGNTFHTRDGAWLLLIAGSEEHFSRLLKAMGREDLVDNPAMATPADRMAQPALVEKVVSDWLAGLDAFEAEQRLSEVGVVHARVSTVSEVYERARSGELGQLLQLRTSAGSEIPVAASPIHLSDTPVALTHQPPTLGEESALIETVREEWSTAAAATDHPKKQ